MKRSHDSLINVDQLSKAVFATIDLQGFSNHLELANVDPRTEIGGIALRRLNNLKAAMAAVEQERATFPEIHPSITCHRINDMLMLNLDLPGQFLPMVGEQEASAFSTETLEQLVPDYLRSTDAEEFRRRYSDAVARSLPPLVKFIGLVARIYAFIENSERENHWPGAKAVVSIGLRRHNQNEKGEDDPFSLNLAFTQSYVASDKLKGSGFFLDGEIAHYLSADPNAQRILWNGLHLAHSEVFDPKALPRDVDAFRKEQTWKLSEAVEVEIFRRKRRFFPSNRSLGYLQFVEVIHSGRYDTPAITNLREHIAKIGSQPSKFTFNNFLLIWVELGQSMGTILGLPGHGPFDKRS